MSPLHVEGGVLGGALLDAVDTVFWRNAHAPGGYQEGRLMPGGVVAWLMSDGITVDSARRSAATDPTLLLDLRRRDAQHAVVDVLKAGERCLRCAGSGRVTDVRYGPDESDPCSACRGTGYTRPPHDLRALLPVVLGGEVRDAVAEERMPQDDGGGTIRVTVPAATVSALLLVASVRGVEARRGVVRGVLSPWIDDPLSGLWADRTTMSGAHANATERPHGWAFCQAHRASSRAMNVRENGPETGPEGRAKADAAALTHGFALLDATAPFGVRVPDLAGGGDGK